MVSLKKFRHSRVFVLGVACVFSFSFCERGQLYFFLKKFRVSLILRLSFFFFFGFYNFFFFVYDFFLILY